MTIPRPDPIVAGYAMICEQLEDLTTAKAALEACWPQLRAGVEVLPRLSSRVDPPAPVKQLAAPPAKRKIGRPRKVAPQPAEPVARSTRGAGILEAAVLEFLATQSEPSKVQAIADALHRSRPAVTIAIGRLVATKQIVRTGATMSTRVGLPAVMGQATTEAPVGKTGKPVRPSRLPERTTNAPWREAIIAKLESGASYSREELIKCAQRASETVTGDMVTTALDALVGEGLAARIPAGDTVRYQRRVKPRAKTA